MEKVDREKGEGRPAGSGAEGEEQNRLGGYRGDEEEGECCRTCIFSLQNRDLLHCLPDSTGLPPETGGEIFGWGAEPSLVLRYTIPLVQNQNHWRINTVLSGFLPASWENLNVFCKTA